MRELIEYHQMSIATIAAGRLHLSAGSRIRNGPRTVWLVGRLAVPSSGAARVAPLRLQLEGAIRHGRQEA
jgi:hypothetical protein